MARTGRRPARSKRSRRALAAIDAIYGIEAGHEANQEVASPPNVQEFWNYHRQLPGFAVGSWSLRPSLTAARAQRMRSEAVMRFAAS